MMLNPVIWSYFMSLTQFGSMLTSYLCSKEEPTVDRKRGHIDYLVVKTHFR